MKSGKRRLILFLLSAAMMLTMSSYIAGAPEVYAAESNGVIGTLNGTSYTSFEKLASALKSNYENKSVTIEMKGNWNAAGSDDFDRRLVIPKGCSATLNMHGYVFNRNRAFRNNSDSNGELICLEDRSRLTIVGASTDAEKKIEHPLVATYSSTDSSKTANKSITTKGGTLTGGCDSWGSGGVQMHEYASLILNDVTIAGCSTRGSGTWSGLGGGIYMADDSGKVTMNNSTITGCFADVDGGGIYANGEPETIELNNSTIDRNYAEENGGGIYTNNQTINISGLNGSEISDNEAGGYGGGVCLWYGDSSLSGFKIYGNKAKYGAGVHLDSKGLSLSDLVITGNTSSSSGGGIFVHKDNNTIASCVIRDNFARGDGGGVFVDDNGINEGFSVTGKTIVRDNTAKGMGNQFHISSSNPEKTRVKFNLLKGSEIWISYAHIGSQNNVMVTPGKVGDTIKSPNCIQYLHPSNGGWHFSFNSNPSVRKIYYVRDGSADPGEPYVKPNDPVDVHPKDAIYNPEKTTSTDNPWAGRMIENVVPGGDPAAIGQKAEYALIRGFTRHEETDSDSNDSAVTFFYSDAFFDETISPYDYNTHLATASLNMAYAGMYLRAQEEPDRRDGSGNYYYNRHAAARQFMADIGCPDQKIYVNESNEKKPQTDSIGVTIASKELAKVDRNDKPVPTGYTLIPIVVRGGGYELEWASNATLDTAEDTGDRGKEAKGFSSAADQVEKEIDYYIQKYDLADAINEGKVRFWITGYSRAGATANLTAKRLVEKYASDPATAGKNNKVFAYTCEAPMGGSDTAEKLDDKSKYYCIHNMINAADLVPHVAPQLMGFKRYGVDHYIPGKNEGAVKSTDQLAGKTGKDGKGIKRGGAHGIGSATTYSDNEITYIKNNQSDPHLKTMKQQLRCIDSGIIFDDYFHPMAIKFISIPPVNIYEEGHYDNNHAEAFIPDFLRFLQEGMDPDDIADATQAVQNRDMFARALQPSIREMLALVMTMDSQTSAGTIGRISTIMSKFTGITGKIAMAEIYSRIVRGWDDRTEAEKQGYYTLFWNIIKSTGALDFLSESDVSRMEKSWPAMANLVFTLLNADWEYNPEKYHYSDAWAGGADGTNMFLGTFATFSTYILQSHYPEVNLAWARSYDSYYSREETEYETLYQERARKAGYSVTAPVAYGKKYTRTEEGETEEPVKLKTIGTNKLSGDQKIILENENIVGEAVYYDLKDNDTGAMLATNLLYRGGVDISLGSAPTKSYTLTAYDISYGVRSEKAVYDITITNDRHLVTVFNGSSTKYEYYREGDTVSISALPPSNQFFTHWRIRLAHAVDGRDKTVESDIADKLLGKAVNDPTATFTMPIENSEYDSGKKYPQDYHLDVQTWLAFRIDRIEVPPYGKALITPQAGKPLAQTTAVKLRPDQGTSFIPEEEGLEIQYPISWTYSYEKDGETKTVPASGTAYSDTVYTASITIPQDVAKGIAFLERLSGITSDPSNSRVKSISRNDADGSATIEIEFNRTGEGGDLPPEADIPLTVKAYDLNLQDYRGKAVDYHVHPNGEVTLTAKNVTDEVFVRWNFANTGITLAEGYEETDRTVIARIPSVSSTAPLVIEAQYIPVVNEITATVQQPAAGQVMQTSSVENTLRVKVYNEYDIHPDFVNIDWAPLPLDQEGTKVADYLTSYTATVSIRTKTDDKGDYLMAKKVGETEYKRMTATFFYSEHPQATFNGEAVPVDTEDGCIRYTFPMTKYTLVSVQQPDNISGVAHGADAGDIQKLLPQSLNLTLDDGTVYNWPVKWELTPGQHSDGQFRDAVVWTAEARLQNTDTLLETVVDPDGLLNKPVKVEISVNEAEHAQSPEADLDTGIYFYDQQTMLTTEEENGEIRYAIGTGKDLEYKTYDGEPIELSRNDQRAVTDKDGRKMLVLNAYTKKGAKWDSAVVTYTYIFDNEFPLPNGHDLVYNCGEQVGVASSEFFTIKSVSDGGKVEEGSAVATDAGKYQAVLEIADGYKWVIYHYTETKDQTVDLTKVYYKKVQIGEDEYEYERVSQEELDPGDEGDQAKIEVNPAANGWYEKVKETTDGEQTVTFTIHQADLSEVAEVSAQGTFKSLEDLKKALKVVPLDDRILTEGKDYEVKYEESEDGKVAVTVSGIGNYTGAISGTYIIDESQPEKKKYTITLDLNGGELDGKTGSITEEFYEDTVLTLPEPSRDGYSFDYWKGSRYEAGEKYTVKVDHIFRAQWNKKQAGSQDSGSQDSGSQDAADKEKSGKGASTGDHVNVLGWLALFAAACAGMALIGLRRRKRNEE